MFDLRCVWALALVVLIFAGVGMGHEFRGAHNADGGDYLGGDSLSGYGAWVPSSWVESGYNYRYYGDYTPESVMDILNDNWRGRDLDGYVWLMGQYGLDTNKVFTAYGEYPLGISVKIPRFGWRSYYFGYGSFRLVEE